jgi:hypothetical protein
MSICLYVYYDAYLSIQSIHSDACLFIHRTDPGTLHQVQRLTETTVLRTHYDAAMPFSLYFHYDACLCIHRTEAQLRHTTGVPRS